MPTKVSDIGRTNMVSVGPWGPTSDQRIARCRSMGTDTENF